MTIQLRSLILEGKLDTIPDISNLFIEEFASMNQKELKNLEEIIESSNSSNSKKGSKGESFAPSKRIEGEVNLTDTCFTGIIKLIGKKKLLEKYKYSGEKFLDKYAEIKKPIKLTKKNIKKVKKGTIILFWYQPDSSKRNGVKLNNMYQNGQLYNTIGTVGNAAHFGIVIDPNRYLILHTSNRSFDSTGNPIGVGSQLELLIQSFPKFFKEPESKDYYALDMNVINKM